MPAFEEEPETEPLNVADTRPAMLGVVPYTWGVPSIMTAVAIDMKFHALFLGPCIMGPILFLTAVLVRRDYWMLITRQFLKPGSNPRSWVNSEATMSCVPASTRDATCTTGGAT